MSYTETHYGRYSLHGLAVELGCEVLTWRSEIDRLLGKFAVSDWPAGFVPLCGMVRPYDESEVLRHLSPTAQRVHRPGELIELYEEEERYWLIDDRWGLAEINLLRGHWRSWVLNRPQVDAPRCAEMAILWPMAQLLRARGLHLLPAASVVRDGAATLIISPFGIESELSALVREGYQIIGQRWTAIREEEGRIALLHLPGQVEWHYAPRLRMAGSWPLSGWVDLTAEQPETSRNHAFCESVLIVEPGRRTHASWHEIPAPAAVAALRSAWPIVDLHPQRRHGRLPARIAQRCRCWQVQLSRHARDLGRAIDSTRRLSIAA